ncbi:MAG: FxSxx-COOH system tetratricopeptide repeat protein [Ktedonobacteraceae bacterium]
MHDRVGQQFGNYRLLRCLGQGGFAQVYLGEHVYLQTQAAIKILHMRLAQSELKGFLQEARVIAHVAHPHIIQVIDFGLEGSIPYLVMQYAQQGSLRQHHPFGSIVPLSSIVTYIQAVASALQHAHTQHLIHRDVKPENMLLDKQRELLLSDFGVAVMTRDASKAQQESGGTIAYMAPEQINGLVSPASDQYALGVVVYEWLCGKRPFNGTIEEIVQQHLHTSPLSPCVYLPTLSPAVEQVVLKALAKEPQHRFASIADFAAALAHASQAQEIGSYALASTAPFVTDHVAVEQTSVSISHPPALSIATPVRSLPYRRNPFFTGREEVLQTLYSRLHEGDTLSWTYPQAISGLGGIGKTQTAIEYAYRYHADYATILWARAETYETLRSDFLNFAYLLNLSEQDEQDQERVIEAVKHWLEEHTHWLLILDNVEDLTMVNSFIPVASRGHSILTTRIQATGNIARCIDLEKLEPGDATLFLLRRAGIIQRDAPLEDASSADSIEARDIAQAMDGLPLALDQAGAYIEETGCGLYDYLDRYRGQRGTLLHLRGEATDTHPEPVATTWLLSFEKVEQAHPAAAELLRFCAFLHPDEILEELIIDGAPVLGPLLARAASDPYTLDAALAMLRKFSLVRRNAQRKTLTIHRLVQAILRDRMDEQAQRLWAERVVRAVNLTFPKGDQADTWPHCQRCLPQVYVCVTLMAQWHMTFAEAARLLDQAGLYLLEQAQYTQARYLLRKALTIREQVPTAEHLDMAETMNYLAGTYLYQGMYAQAETLFIQVLATREHIQGPAHPDVAIELNNLALLYQKQGKYTQAEPLFLRALTIWEQAQGTEEEMGVEHPDVARTLNNLAFLYQMQHKFVQAESLYLRALTIWEHIHGLAHPDVAVSLNNLAKLYHQLGKYSQAKPLFQRVLEIRETTLGPEHPAVAHSLTYLAKLYQQQWKYTEAELLFKHALQLRKHALGPEHPEVAQSLNDLGRLYTTLGKFTSAEPLFQQALHIFEQTLEPEHLDVANTLKNYALLLSAMQRKDEAVQLVIRIKAIQVKHAPQLLQHA